MMAKAGVVLLQALCISLLVAMPVGAVQAGENVYRVGLIATTPVARITSDPTHPVNSGFRREMRDRGYLEGKNLVLELRSVEGRVERTSPILAELIRLNVNVVVTISTEMTQEARRVTTSVPIVMAGSRDPVKAGFATSLARPGGNITGLTIDVGEALEPKRLELLREALPTLQKVAYLGSKADWESLSGRSIRAAAKPSGLALFLAEPGPNEYGAAFRLIARDRAQAIVISANARHYTHRVLIAELAAKNKLPIMAYFRDFVDVGALMSYGVDPRDLYRRVAIYVDKILKGTRPGDLPIEQPTTFELVVNLNVAKVLGLTIPSSVLTRATDVIQ